MKYKRDVEVFITMSDTSVNPVESESEGSSIDLTQPQREMPTPLNGAQSATGITDSRCRVTCF